MRISAKAEKRREGRLEQLWQRREEKEFEGRGREEKNGNAGGWFLIYCFSHEMGENEKVDVGCCLITSIYASPYEVVL